MKNIKELADYIHAKTGDNERFIIAISGFGGAGKSTLSERLRVMLSDATLIHADDFINADGNGVLEGYHLDWERLENEVINVAKSADKLTLKIYDWGSNRQVFETVSAGKYVIIEGSIWLMQDKFKPYFDTTVWVNVPQDVANARGKKRDNQEYGVNHDDLWDNFWGPREKDSFIKLQPDKHADILLNNYF